MTSNSPFSLADILAIARIHPFYVLDVKYPPDADTIHAARERASQTMAESNLKAQPFLWKSTLWESEDLFSLRHSSRLTFS